MNVVWGVVLIVVGMLAWAGQAYSWLSPLSAARLGLTETEEAVEPAFWADVRGEAAWDTLTLWTLVVAGVLLIADVGVWAPFGLVGGGMYAYFGGRGIFTRLTMRRRGLRIGAPGSVTSALVFLGVWLVVGVITIVAAAVSL